MVKSGLQEQDFGFITIQSQHFDFSSKSNFEHEHHRLHHILNTSLRYMA